MLNLNTFYQSKPFRKLVDALRLERTNEDGVLICERCGKPINRKYDCIAHHVIELNEDNVNDYNVSLNPDNIKLIHLRCHNEEHQRFGGFHQDVYLVYGSPCAGKTTWVREIANDDDLILDIDAIWESVCKCDRLHKPKRLRANVFGVRDEILDQIRTRTGMWRNAFVIGTYPLRSDRDRLCDLLRARPVYIEAEKDECLARAPSDEWREYVEEWFDSFVE